MRDDKGFYVRVLQGMHVGASAAFSRNERCIVGSDTSCSIALLDDGVMPVHCAVYWEDGALKCYALQGEVRNGPELIGQGEGARIRAGVPLLCGTAHLLIESEDEAQAGAGSPESLLGRNSTSLNGSEGRMRAIYHLFGMNGQSLTWKFRLILLGVVLAFGLSGVAVALVTWGDDAQSNPLMLAEVRAWLRGISPPGSELRVEFDREALRFVIAGYVPTDYQGELLKRALKESRYVPRADFLSAEGMVTSFVRLVQMEKLMCVAEYVGMGLLRCTNEIANSEQATRIRMLAHQVAGVSDVSLKVAPPRAEPTTITRVVTVPSPVAVSEPVANPGWIGPRLGGKLSVWILKKDKFFVDWRGIKYREGDKLEGMTVENISVDQVRLSRDGNPYSIMVALQ